MFGAESMTQYMSAPGNQNGKLLHLIMCNHLSKIAVTGKTFLVVCFDYRVTLMNKKVDYVLHF